MQWDCAVGRRERLGSNANTAYVQVELYSQSNYGFLNDVLHDKTLAKMADMANMKT